ncbi:MAG TPA: TetR/AcrR family transcriptional regulator [Polyangia bacterium]|nr:TetR/AcrR family transcriptional regulator [Polyangia bacterium]
MGRTSDARERLIEATIELTWQDGTVSVDAICERSQVKKGSFYHFFKSKDELVIAALEAHWASRKPHLDRIFSPTVLPLERLRAYFAYVFQRQKELKAKHGQFVGCFYTTVGMSCAPQSPAIAEKVQEILANYTRYYESALRDAVARGDIGNRRHDVVARAKNLFAFMEGVLAQARLQDDAEIIRTLGASAFAFLGIEEPRAAAHRKSS